MINEFISGGIAGCVSIAAGQPFDTIKVQLQTSAKFSGPVDCFKYLVKRDGFPGLFKGMTPPLVTATAANAVVFTCHKYTLGHVRALRGVLQENSYVDLFLSGAVAGFVSSFIQCPTELVKIKLQLSTPGQYSGTIACVKEIIRSGGVSGLFQGMSATLLREVPAFGFYFWSQKLSEDHLNSLHLPPFASSFISGGIAGAVSWTVAYPIDVAKTEIQMVSSSTPRNERTILSILRRIVANQGWLFLYRGLGTTILRSLPVNAVLFPTHKFCSEFLSKEFDL